MKKLISNLNIMIICVLPDNIPFFEMGNARKAKARKVYTPGSKPPGNAFSPGRGRPKKAKDVRKGSMRKGNYRTKYSQATIELAIQDIQEKRLSLNKAAKHYNVPKATLSNRINQLVQDQLGRPTELKKEEEEIIVERLMMMGDWGFPLTCKDLCLLIKSYLDGQGRTTRKMSRLTLPVISCFFFNY
jgi:transposase-like protein